jgi:hypothetical protein
MNSIIKKFERLISVFALLRNLDMLCLKSSART